jgi:hypothetical protein
MLTIEVLCRDTEEALDGINTALGLLALKDDVHQLVRQAGVLRLGLGGERRAVGGNHASKHKKAVFFAWRVGGVAK